jgi:hypothetical protein
VKAAFEQLEISNVKLPQTATMPIFDDLFPTGGEPVEQLPLIKYALEDVTLIMHSSGSCFLYYC